MLCKKPYMSGVIPCPCGQCLPCRINRRRVWTTRLLLESYMHSRSCFLTLTYDAEHLPAGGTLVPRDAQLFLKRLRKAVSPAALRFFLAGEYGDNTLRPHYHLAIFGFGCDFARPNDPARGLCSCDDCSLVRSAWARGHIQVDQLTPESAQYICGYVIKKMTSKTDPRLKGLHPEFSRQSNRPGIGRPALQSLLRGMVSDHGEIFFDGDDVPKAIHINGKMMPFGRYLINNLRQKVGIHEVSKEAYVQELHAMWQDASSNSENPPISIRQMLLDQNAGRVELIEAQHRLYSKEGAI